MKSIIFALYLFSVQQTNFAQTENQHAILEKFIAAHNVGTDEAIKKFIKECYDPTVYSKLDLASHVAFYKQIIDDFGPLNNQIYEKVLETNAKLIVHLIKKNESLMNNKIDPAEILVVELDMSKDNPKYMSRGLGLGALVCEIRKE